MRAERQSRRAIILDDLGAFDCPACEQQPSTWVRFTDGDTTVEVRWPFGGPPDQPLVALDTILQPIIHAIAECRSDEHIQVDSTHILYSLDIVNVCD